MAIKNTLEARISYRIKRSKATVFIRQDFADIGGYDQIGRILRLLVRNQQLISLGYGLYARTKISSISGKIVPIKPVQELACEALIKLGVKTTPTFSDLAYKEGRSNQVPTGRVIGVNSRISRKISYGGTSITFEKTFTRAHQGRCNIQSIINNVLDKKPETEIMCISPVETAGNKISALSWRVLIRDRGDPKDDPTIIRHLHDIASLENMITANLNDFIPIAEASLMKDKQKRAGKTLANLSNREILFLALNRLENDSVYEDEYETFVMNMSYANDHEKIHFKNAYAAFNRIIEKIYD